MAEGAASEERGGGPASLRPAGGGRRAGGQQTAVGAVFSVGQGQHVKVNNRPFPPNQGIQVILLRSLFLLMPQVL